MVIDFVFVIRMMVELMLGFVVMEVGMRLMFVEMMRLLLMGSLRRVDNVLLICGCIEG